MTLLELLEKVYGKCYWQEPALTRVRQLAELAAAEEREACAAICEREAANCYGEAQRCEDAIRDRK